jgi:hopene-associated glycosyltransferase HpnB
MLALSIACAAAAVAWAYLVLGHGRFWRAGEWLPPRRAEPGRWPDVVAVVPARNEAAMLPATLPTLLGQDYPGALSVILVDDCSSDGTAEVAAKIGLEAGRPLRVVPGAPAPGPPGTWAGKVWAMAQGLAAAGEPGYVLFTDADIAWEPGALRDLAAAAVGDDRDLVSQMALLRTATRWERVVVPAFVYFFAQLYPFRRVNRPGSRTAAAAGGCMLVRREALQRADGLAPISGARIDDVALGRLLKRRPGRCWLGLSTRVVSVRPYPALADLWQMVARSAYIQLGYSPWLLAGTVAGLLFIYVLPPAGAITGLAVGATTGLTGPAALAAGAGLAGWALMTLSYLPMLRLYRLSPWRGLTLPLIALLYAAMTVDSARRHYAGRGAVWKGRTDQARLRLGPWQRNKRPRSTRPGTGLQMGKKSKKRAKNAGARRSAGQGKSAPAGRKPARGGRREAAQHAELDRLLRGARVRYEQLLNDPAAASDRLARKENKLWWYCAALLAEFDATAAQYDPDVLRMRLLEFHAYAFRLGLGLDRSVNQEMQHRGIAGTLAALELLSAPFGSALVSPAPDRAVVWALAMLASAIYGNVLEAQAADAGFVKATLTVGDIVNLESVPAGDFDYEGFLERGGGIGTGLDVIELLVDLADGKPVPADWALLDQALAGTDWHSLTILASALVGALRGGLSRRMWRSRPSPAWFWPARLTGTADKFIESIYRGSALERSKAIDDALRTVIRRLALPAVYPLDSQTEEDRRMWEWRESHGIPQMTMNFGTVRDGKLVFESAREFFDKDRDILAELAVRRQRLRSARAAGFIGTGELGWFATTSAFLMKAVEEFSEYLGEGTWPVNLATDNQGQEARDPRDQELLNRLARHKQLRERRFHTQELLAWLKVPSGIGEHGYTRGRIGDGPVAVAIGVAGSRFGLALDAEISGRVPGEIDLLVADPVNKILWVGELKDQEAPRWPAQIRNRLAKARQYDEKLTLKCQAVRNAGVDAVAAQVLGEADAGTGWTLESTFVVRWTAAEAFSDRLSHRYTPIYRLAELVTSPAPAVRACRAAGWWDDWADPDGFARLREVMRAGRVREPVTGGG